MNTYTNNELITLIQEQLDCTPHLHFHGLDNRPLCAAAESTRSEFFSNLDYLRNAIDFLDDYFPCEGYRKPDVMTAEYLSCQISHKYGYQTFPVGVAIMAARIGDFQMKFKNKGSLTVRIAMAKKKY